MQTDQPISPSAIIKGQHKRNQAGRGIWSPFALMLVSCFSSLDCGGEGIGVNCPISACTLVCPPWVQCWPETWARLLLLGALSTGAGGGSLTPLPSAFCSFVPPPIFPLKEVSMQCIKDTAPLAHELSYHMLNHFSWQNTAPCATERMTVVVVVH